MTSPPPPDPFGRLPPPGGGPPGGGVPHGLGYGLPPQDQWVPQQQWLGVPGGQAPKGGKGKWLLGGVAVVVSVVLAVVIAVVVVRSGNGDSDTSTTQEAGSEFVSAADNGPVNIITDDRTCEAWGRVAREYAARAETVNWGDRDKSVPVSAWTPEQRTMYRTVGDAMSRAADQAENLAKQTPHRVMRELYEQFIAYVRAFTSKLSSYAAADAGLGIVVDTIGTATANICSAIDYGSAPAIGPLVKDPEKPTSVEQTAGGSSPEILMPTPNSICSEWNSVATKYHDDTAAWRSVDPALSAAEWTPDQRSIIDSVIPIVEKNADELESLARRSGKPELEDFALLAAQYQRALAAAIPQYEPSDNFLSQSATHLVRAINSACKAVA